MSVWGWLILAGYLVGFVATWRRAAWLVVDDFKFSSTPDGDDVAMGILVGAVVALFWPVVAPAYFAHTRGLLAGPRGFLREPAVSRREREVEQRERRIAELERELNIR